MQLYQQSQRECDPPICSGPEELAVQQFCGRSECQRAVYTMVEMAKAHGLNIYGYLKFLLEHRPGKDMTDEQLAELAPWSEKLQSIKNRM